MTCLTRFLCSWAQKTLEGRPARHGVGHHKRRAPCRTTAIRAGYSAKTAGEIGHENLKKPQIADAVAVAQAATSAETKLTRDMVIDGLLKVAQDQDPSTSPSARVQAWGMLARPGDV